MNYLDVKNVCRLLDLATTDILGQVSVLATRIGYRTEFLDHSTIYVGSKSSECIAVLKTSELDEISGILKACSICKEKRIGFLITETNEISKYAPFLAKLKSKQFFVTHPEPNIVLIGYNGIIKFFIRVFTKSNLINQIQRLQEIQVPQPNFLEMSGTKCSIQNTVKEKDIIQLQLLVSFNIVESYSLIAERYTLLIKEIFIGHQIDLSWGLEYKPWYDFSLNISNRIKLGALYLSSTKVRSLAGCEFHEFFRLSRYGQVVCFNYTPTNGDRVLRIEETARLYKYLSHPSCVLS